jgi:hypothetical protein
MSDNREPILDTERFSGDTQTDTRYFQLVVAATQGILAGSPNISPETLSLKALTYAKAVFSHLKKRGP